MVYEMREKRGCYCEIPILLTNTYAFFQFVIKSVCIKSEREMIQSTFVYIECYWFIEATSFFPHCELNLCLTE